MIKAEFSYNKRTHISCVKIFYKDRLFQECHFDGKEIAQLVTMKLNQANIRLSDYDAEKRLKDLKNICDIQCSEGNFDVNEYMRGMANGLILAVSIFEGTDPKYIEEKV